MSFGTVTGAGGGLADVQARIASIKAQMAALAAPVAPRLPAAIAPAAAASLASPATAQGTFAAALDSAMGRQTLGAGGSTSPLGLSPAPSLSALPGLAGLGAPSAATPTAGPSTPAAGSWVLPVQGGRISSVFGPRSGVAGRAHEHHTGLDIAAPSGTPVKAASDGVVISAGSAGNYGNAVVVDHGNGVTTRYAHNSKLHVTEGQQIRAGDTIAAVGSTGRSTGPHLHFEVRVNGDAVDPAEWLKSRSR